MAALSDIGEAMPKLYEAYLINKLPLTTPDNTIIIANFTRFLQLLTRSEEALLNIVIESKDSTLPPSFREEVLTRRTLAPTGTITTVTTNGVSTASLAPIEEVKVDYAKFRSEWYTRALAPHTQKGTNLLEELAVANPVNNDNITAMCEYYLTMMQWVMYYYTGRPVTTNLSYPYLLAPMLADSVTYLREGRSDW